MLEHEVQRPSPGYAEMDARIWWGELTSIVSPPVGAREGALKSSPM
ncbi:hypothetical protein FM103_14255 [Corynebacterium xerosis]|nr:hypothetical protein FM103_14255 [Corynebacterium xerosis]